MAMKKPMEMKLRLSKLFVKDDNDCWNWTSQTQGVGYGRIKVGGRYRQAHRVSYEVHCEKVPDGMVVMHICDNKLCINPEHLRAGTQKENMLDAIVKGRAQQLTSAWLKSRGRGY